MTAPKSVFIIRPGALGDAVLTLPTLRALKASGTERITVLGNPSSWAFMPPDEPDFEVLDWNTNNWLALFSPDAKFPPNVLTKLKTFDLAVVYLKPDRTEAEGALLKAGVKHVIGITPPGMDETGEVHASEWLLGPLREKLGLQDGEKSAGWWDKPGLMRGSEIIPVLEKYGLYGSRPMVSFHPGSGGAKKCWPAEHFAEIARCLVEVTGWMPVLISGPADDAAMQRFEQRWATFDPNTQQELQRIRHAPLSDIKVVCSHSRLFVGNDSGLTHLAAILSRKTIALFGLTDPRTWRPLGHMVDIVTASDDGSLAPMENLSEKKVLLAMTKRLGLSFS